MSEIEAWYERQRKRIESRKRSITELSLQLKRAVLAEVDTLTAGTLTYADLERLDHPYARRHGRPLVPPLPINRHTGRLWRSVRVIPTRYRTTYHLQFTAPYSKYVLAVEGTRKMLPRGFWQAIAKRIKEIMVREVNRYGE